MNERTTDPRGTARAGRRASPGLDEPGAGGGSSAADDRMMALEARLAELERDTSLGARGRGLMDRMMPPEASQHFRNAWREQLLGMRAIVDFWIHRVEAADKRAEASRERIEIE